MSSPEQVGAFVIEGEIGRGGMGVVYRARDTRLERDVAIKALPEDLADDADRMARFRREATFLASLNHPHVAAVYGLEEAEGRQYLVLEYVDGDTIDEIIARGALPMDEALRVAEQVAEAMAPSPTSSTRSSPTAGSSTSPRAPRRTPRRLRRASFSTSATWSSWMTPRRRSPSGRRTDRSTPLVPRMPR